MVYSYEFYKNNWEYTFYLELTECMVCCSEKGLSLVI